MLKLTLFSNEEDHYEEHHFIPSRPWRLGGGGRKNPWFRLYPLKSIQGYLKRSPQEGRIGSRIGALSVSRRLLSSVSELSSTLLPRLCAQIGNVLVKNLISKALTFQFWA